MPHELFDASKDLPNRALRQVAFGSTSPRAAPGADFRTLSPLLYPSTPKSQAIILAAIGLSATVGVLWRTLFSIDPCCAITVW